MIRKVFVFLYIITFFSTLTTVVYSQGHGKGQNTIGDFVNRNNEKGILPVANYSSLEYNARPQNWAIIRDHRGLMYFGNNEALLEFDGTRWRKILTPDEAAIRSLAIDNDGKIYVGVKNDFGFVSPDSSGKLLFRSLTHLLPEKYREFGDIWHTLVTDEGVYFQSSNMIFRFNGNTIKVWEAEKNNVFHNLFYVNKTIYIDQRNIGLKKMIDDRLVLIQGGELLAESKIYFMLGYNGKEGKDSSQIILNTRNRGLLLLSPTPKDYFPKDRKAPEYINKFTPFPISINDFLIANAIYSGIRIDDNTYSIGTLGGGVVVLNKEGGLKNIINKNTGIQNATVYNQFIDNQDNLWVALANGLSKVKINSPITSFNDQVGLEGTIQDITRSNEHLYVATLLGIYYLPTLEDRQRGKEINPESLIDYEPMFMKVEGVTNECWDLLSFEELDEDLLLFSANLGIYQIDHNRVQSFVAKYDTWKMFRSSSDPQRVFLGTSAGLACIYRENGQWIDQGYVDGIEGNILNVYEDSMKNIWLSTPTVMHRMNVLTYRDNKIDEIKLTTFDSISGLPEGGPVNISSKGNKLLFGTLSGGLFVFNPATLKFQSTDLLGDKFFRKKIGIHRMSKDKSGKFWLVSHSIHGGISIGHITPRIEEGQGEDPEWINTPFMGLSHEIKHAVYHDDDGVTWLGGPDGLFRFDANILKEYDQKYYALIRKVTLGKDSVLFWGANYDKNGAITLMQQASQMPTLPYAFNSMEFEFAAPNFPEDASNKFSYYLEGFDKGWSSWSAEAKKEYTNLPENSYRFRVKAIDTYNHQSEEAVYSFTILPPWHRTVWAYIGYLMAFILFVYAAITISTRGLQRIIKQKTAEVVKQKEEIELKNKDITDSINYAQKIQEAILPSDLDIKKHLPENFVLFKPKDIVSGDFYWFSKKEDKAFIAAADCTGHGVPGAFMSMIGNSLLNEIVNDRGVDEPAKILQQLKEGVIKSLKQTGEAGKQKDGMDIALCAFDFKNNKLEFSGAYNPLIRIREGELEETRSDRMPIGIYSDDGGRKFTNYELEMKKGDMYYFFTDGYVDQFGGPKGKKFMGKRFKMLLKEIYQLPMKNQKQKLDEVVEGWKSYVMADGSTYEQMDDILVIGVKV